MDLEALCDPVRATIIGNVFPSGSKRKVTIVKIILSEKQTNISKPCRPLSLQFPDEEYWLQAQFVMFQKLGDNAQVEELEKEVPPIVDFMKK